jgi:hypothetical protein
MPVPDFSPGEVLTAAAMDSIGLWKIASATATSGTALSVDDVFTSTYSNYLLYVSGLPTSGSFGLDLRLRASGTDAVTGYYYGMTRVDIAAASINVTAGNNSTIFATGAIADTSGRTTAVIQVLDPQLAQYSSFASQATDNRGSAAYGGINSGGQLKNTTQYDGFSLLFGGGSGTISYLKVDVYGYRL